MVFVVTNGQLSQLDTRASLTTPVASSMLLADDSYADYAAIWRQQPQVRTVVDFIARNIAQLGLQLYRRASDVDRQRITTGELAGLIKKPNNATTRYRLIDGLVHDLAIYDAAFWLKTQTKVRDQTSHALWRIPPIMVEAVGASAITGPTGYRVRGSAGTHEFPADQIIAFRGYNPVDTRLGCSPMESLRHTLAEERQAAIYRAQLWRNGARFGGYIRRPVEAPQWTDNAKKRFRTSWAQQYTGVGGEVGSTPILEDGMEWVSAGMTPEQAQWHEARKLTREEVAAAFHVPPPMVGILDHATFSNITEQHKQLYQDTLGPWLTMICEELTLQLLPDFPDSDDVYFEFNLAEKLRGSFEEQASQLQTAVGGPWLTRNEARARQNLPQIEGADELIVPLNVATGSQPAPAPEPADAPGQDETPQSPKTDRKTLGSLARVNLKTKPSQAEVARAEKIINNFFTKQQDQLEILFAGNPDADFDSLWDSKSWNDELIELLDQLGRRVSRQAALAAMNQLGIDPMVYSEAKTVAFLRSQARKSAVGVNARTGEQVQQVLQEDDRIGALKTLFEGVMSARAHQIAQTQVTALSGFGSSEAVRQSGKPATKTWSVLSAKPRQSHAAINGETVGVDETFSNGARWPGDSVLSDDERAGCTCALDITLED